VVFFTISDFPANGNRLGARDIVELAKWSEACGLDRFAVSDFPFHQDCLVQMGACLAVTERLVVESLVTTPYIRGPDQTAAAWATLAELSGGRAILGVGKGGAAPRVYAGGWGFERPDAESSVRDLIDVCRTMWDGGTPALSGTVLRTSGRPLDMRPPPHIPVLLAARGLRMLAVGGELADIVHLGAPFLGPEYLRRRVDAVERGAAAAGRPRGQVEIDMTVSISLGEEREARAAGELTSAAAILWLSEGWGPGRVSGAKPAGWSVPDDVVETVKRDWDVWSGDPLPAHVRALLTDDVLHQFTIWGQPSECAGRIDALLAQVPGVTGVRLKLPGRLAVDGYREMIALAGEVATRLRELRPDGTPAAGAPRGSEVPG
jgi:5,10-methylenetetrahydromethanopterin reductase